MTLPTRRQISTVLGLALASVALANEPEPGYKSAPVAVKRVLLLSIDGLHAVNLANYILSNPNSTLSQLSGMGITYTNASTALPSDSIPGLLAQVTGGSPRTTGIWYEVTYHRELCPAGSMCKSQGTVVKIDDEIDYDPTKLDGGGINPALLPLDPQTGASVYPHQMLRVNTVFEVLHEHKMHTAWVDKHLAYEILNGPSGKGVDDLYTPEIAAINPKSGHDWAATLNDVEMYDRFKVAAILNEIDGLDHEGKIHVGVPVIFGMNFQSVHIAQKHHEDPGFGKCGYLDINATPGPALREGLRFVDEQLGEIITALKKNQLFDSTLIIISAKHGESPIDIHKRRIVDMTLPAKIVGPSYAYDQSDTGSLIWLKDQSQTQEVVAHLSEPAVQEELGIQQIFSGNLLKLSFGDPVTDPRVPDIILKTNPGVIFHKLTNPKIAENGGLNEDDLHVALLVANPSMRPQTYTRPVQTAQIAPTILVALGLDPLALKAVQIEGTPALPSLFDDTYPSGNRRNGQ